jgi:hypothetical protein
MDISHFKEVAVEEISDTLGQKTAEMYSAFYADKSQDIIRMSLTELLIEVVGEDQAKMRMAKINQKIQADTK